jgi:hypothetical protein
MRFTFVISCVYFLPICDTVGQPTHYSHCIPTAAFFVFSASFRAVRDQRTHLVWRTEQVAGRATEESGFDRWQRNESPLYSSRTGPDRTGPDRTGSGAHLYIQRQIFV